MPRVGRCMGDFAENIKKYIGYFILTLLIVGFTFYFILRDQAMSSLLRVLGEVHPVYMILGLGVMFVFICCEGFNIQSLMRSFGQNLRFSKCLKYAFVGFFFSAITPSSSGGQPAQVYYMKKDGISISLSSLSLLIMLMVFQFVSLVYGILMSFLKPSFLTSNISIEGIKLLLIYGVSVNILLMVTIGFMIFSGSLIQKILLRCIRLLEKIKVIKDKQKAEQTLNEYIKEYRNGAKHLKKHPLVLLKVLLTTTTQITALFSVPYIVYKAYGLSGYTLFDMLAMHAMLTLAVSSLPVPGSVGASENSFMVMFRVFFGSHLVLPSMLLSRFISFYFYFFVSGIVCIFAYINIKRRDKSLAVHPRLQPK